MNTIDQLVSQVYKWKSELGKGGSPQSPGFEGKVSVPSSSFRPRQNKEDLRGSTADVFPGGTSAQEWSCCWPCPWRKSSQARRLIQKAGDRRGTF